MGRLWHRLSPLVGLLLFAAALWVLGREVRQLSLQGLWDSVRALPPSSILVAAALTALNYAILTGYDQLAFVYIRRPMPRWQISVASFVGYAIANNVGFALLSGTSARYRFYSRWGLSGHDISRVVVFYSGTFWLGLVVLGAWTLLWSPVRDASLAPAALVRGAGVVLAVTAAGYAIAAVVWKRPFRLFTVELSLPSVPLVAAQYVLSALDWGLGAGVLYVLLPDPKPEYAYFLGAFLAAQIVALVSHVPGGIGVFESLMILLLKPWLTADAFLPALAAYRLVYYLAPLILALGVLVVDEIEQRRHQVVQWGNAFGTLTGAVAPKLLGVFTLLAGAVLMVSGAVPTRTDRLGSFGGWLPHALVEASHLVASLAGLALLAVAWGLARRLAVAYRLAVAMVVVGMVASLSNGAHYEEALALGVLLLALVPSRRAFDRRRGLFEVPFSPTWVAAASAVVLATGVVGLFAFRRVEYTHALWWSMGPDQHAARFLRAMAAVVAGTLALGVYRLRNGPAPALEPPSPQAIDAAVALAARQPRTVGRLVAFGDKALLWSADRDALLMYAVHGDTWVALGDPLGSPDGAASLVREFLDRVDDHQGVPVFYQCTREWLHRYAEFGLTFAKLGEEARVPLAGGPGGGRGRPPRGADRPMPAGCRFRVVPPGAMGPALLDELQRVSDEWLAHQHATEKGFAVASFDRDYAARCSAALVERDGRVEAFALLWAGTLRTELAADLLRHGSAVPAGIVGSLIAGVVRWGSDQGYGWISLGVAPLPDLEQSPVAPLWTRLQRLVHRHGEPPHEGADLRAHAAAFDSTWEPRYLAYPGGFGLPAILADVSTVIAGRPGVRPATVPADSEPEPGLARAAPGA